MKEDIRIRDTIGRFVVGTNPGPGRDTQYHASMNEQAYRLALLGATDKQIAIFFGVSETTINNWKRAHPGFLESLNRGKVFADGEVAEGLFLRAVGMELVEEKLVRASDGTSQTVQLRKQIPPDPRAATMWLAIRQPELWSSRTQIKKHDLDDDENSDLQSMSDEELAAECHRLQELLRKDN